MFHCHDTVILRAVIAHMTPGRKRTRLENVVRQQELSNIYEDLQRKA